MEQWAEIPDFPRYLVSNWGRVVNHETGREMVLTPNQNGDLMVGLMLDGRQYKRSVRLLVARAFVPGEDDRFDTPVLLDNDRTNLHESNIIWRPRWFAHLYRQQFAHPKAYYNAGPLEDRAGNTYETIMQCSMITGSLCKHIMLSTNNGSRTFPGGEVFSYIYG